LIDYDSVELSNCIRHTLGAESVGLFKCHGLQRHIKYHNPFVDIFSKIVNITQSDICDYFIEPGIGISTIADDNTEGYLNEQAIINNKTIFYGRALRGGKAARIFRLIPGKDACFYCLNLYSHDKDASFITIPSDNELPTITNECNNPIRPSSAADLKLISSLLAQIVLEYFEVEDQVNNHWIWSIENIPGISKQKIEAYKLVGSNIQPHPKCPYCKQQIKKTVEINKMVIDHMILETEQNLNVETGGVLLGEILENSFVINFASKPGPNAVKERNRFLKDKDYCQTFIDEMYQKYKESAVYIGEWHFHPSKNNDPSNTDLDSLNNIAIGSGYLTETPTMIILSNKKKASCTIHPARQPFYYTELNIKE
jgi:integrative and conjugative element protein (TIGR02256 family)